MSDVLALPTMAPAPASRREWPAAPGHGIVEISRGSRSSVVTRAYATSPLRLLTPANHGDAAWVFSSTYGGGMVDGDRVALEIDVADGASAYVSTQASTKIYRSPHGTSATTMARVGESALLVLMPDPVALFAGARYAQVQRVDVSANAGVVLVDWVTSGRRASGERWAFESYSGRIAVFDRGRLRMLESLTLDAADGSLEHRLGRFEVLAVVVIAGAMLRLEAQDVVARAAAHRAGKRPDVLIGAMAIEGGGSVLRIAARTTEQAAGLIREHLAFVPGLLGDNPWGRKW